MLRQILPEDAAKAVEKERALLLRVKELVEGADAKGTAVAHVDELLAHLDEMFLLVVVGEVKAGKSAFINAILDADVCPEGPTPLTDRVHVLAYGETEEETVLEEHILRRTVPVKALQQLHVVDTPGTNSPLMRHQEITKGFLPRADIVFFVTSIDCPLTQTEIQLLKEIRERWKKEVACVLSKTDMHPPEHREIVLEYLTNSFREHLGFSPPLLPVSSHAARKARKDGDEEALEASGIPAVERYIVENLSEEQQVRLKLRSPLGAALDVTKRVERSATTQLDVLEDDFKGWKTLEEQIRFAETSLCERAERLVAPIAVAFENLEARGRAFLLDVFRFKNLRVLSDEGRFKKYFEDEVVRGAAGEIESKVEDLVQWLGGETQSLWDRSVAYFEEHVAAKKYADQILAGTGFRERRRAALDEILDSANREVQAWSPEGECARVRQLASRVLSRLLKTEAVAAGLGATMAATLLPSVFGVFGIGLAAAIALGGFFILPARRQKAVENFENGVRRTRDATLEAVRQAVAAEADRAVTAVLDGFVPFRDFYESRRRSLKETVAQAGELQADVRRLQTEIG
ncbi:MAG: dynamin family protein [Planctomycetota bacterium]